MKTNVKGTILGRRMVAARLSLKARESVASVDVLACYYVICPGEAHAGL
jgi:hypothetical protein